jgi:hypothetical protein
MSLDELLVEKVVLTCNECMMEDEGIDDVCEEFVKYSCPGPNHLQTVLVMIGVALGFAGMSERPPQREKLLCLSIFTPFHSSTFRCCHIGSTKTGTTIERSQQESRGDATASDRRRNRSYDDNDSTGGVMTTIVFSFFFAVKIDVSIPAFDDVALLIMLLQEFRDIERF